MFIRVLNMALLLLFGTCKFSFDAKHMYTWYGVIIVVSLEIELHPMPQKMKSQSTKFDRTQDYKEKALHKFHLTAGKRLLDIASCWFNCGFKVSKNHTFLFKINSWHNISQPYHVFHVVFAPAFLAYLYALHALRDHALSHMIITTFVTFHMEVFRCPIN